MRGGETPSAKEKKMKNSRSLVERVAEYRAAGWTVNDMTAKINDMSIGVLATTTRGMTPDGIYDGWLPLPDDAIALPGEDDVVEALAINHEIASGKRYYGVIGPQLPSTWIDHEGNDRNIRLYNEALLAAKADLAQGRKLYVRDGRRYIQIRGRNA